MPKSKRSKVTTLSKTPSRSTKSAKQSLVSEIRNEIDQYDHVWLFSVGDMRNEGLKEVRSQWRGTGRLFFGKGKVMRKALGEGEGDEYQDGLGEVAKRISGQTGLFLTSHSPSETLDWFKSFHKPEYARQNFISTRTITLPSGPILTPLSLPGSSESVGDPFPHSMEPQLRQLGLKTTLVKGVPSLMDEHVLCREGEKLSSEKCRILKLLGVQMAVSLPFVLLGSFLSFVGYSLVFSAMNKGVQAIPPVFGSVELFLSGEALQYMLSLQEFRIHLGSRWTKGEGFVPGDDLDNAGEAAAEDGEMDEDE